MTSKFRQHGIYYSQTLDLSFESQLFTAESIDGWLLRNAEEGKGTQRLKRKERYPAPWCANPCVSAHDAKFF